MTHFQRLRRCLRSTRRARNRWIHACGVEPSLHRDRIISGSKPHRNPAFKQRERAQTHHGVLPRRQRVFAQSNAHAIVEILVLRSRAVSASRSANSRDSNHIYIQSSSNANVPRRIDVDFSVSQRSFTQVDIVATALRTPNSALFFFVTSLLLKGITKIYGLFSTNFDPETKRKKKTKKEKEKKRATPEPRRFSPGVSFEVSMQSSGFGVRKTAASTCEENMMGCALLCPGLCLFQHLEPTRTRW